jgi:hypothetical protein
MATQLTSTRVRGETSTGPARQHIAALVAEQHASLRSIARAAGVSFAAIRQIHARQQNRVSRYCEQLILDTTPEKIVCASTGRNFVPKTGTTRRLEALQSIGWPLTKISEISGVNAEEISSGSGPWGQASHAAAIRETYARLSDHPGPSSRTSIRANKAGYLGPIHWDDDTIEDATYNPLKPPARQSKAEAIVEDVTFLVLTGNNPDEISARLGRPWGTISRRLYRYGRNDLVSEAHLAS